METKPSSILSSSCCFLFEMCAREAASLGDLLQKPFLETFVCEKCVKWAQECTWNLRKTKETKSKQHAQNVFKLMPLTFEQRVFDSKNCNKSLNTEVRTSANKGKTSIEVSLPNPWKLDPTTQQNNCFKHSYPNKTLNPPTLLVGYGACEVTVFS